MRVLWGKRDVSKAFFLQGEVEEVVGDSGGDESDEDEEGVAWGI